MKTVWKSCADKPFFGALKYLYSTNVNL